MISADEFTLAYKVMEFIKKYEFPDTFMGGKIFRIDSNWILMLYEPYNVTIKVCNRPVSDNDLIELFSSATIEYKFKVLGF